jgi:hypothetical protein
VKVRGSKIELSSQLIADWLGSTEELVLLIQGDTLILKKMQILKLSEIAERAPEDEEMPMEEIVAEVHRYRREKSIS